MSERLLDLIADRLELNREGETFQRFLRRWENKGFPDWVLKLV